MPACPSCGAKLLPTDTECRSCGAASPHTSGKVDPLLGVTIADKYTILEHLGSGAMGRVYRARQTALDKEVAIKLMHQHLANDPKVVKRFHREAKTASRLSHPHSLQILDFGEAPDGTLYIAMELLDGDDLLTVIEHDSPLTPARILHFFREILSALEAAHRANIIHRDLKPENVLVLEGPDGDEHVKVCDFGIAKIVEQEGGSAITVTGFVCGTPEYMAPEQARGEVIDRRADIYAAGCMLYQMLTATLPFTAESALGIITKHLTQEVQPPRERRPEWNIPHSLEQVCLTAMAKEREARFTDAGKMLRALEDAVLQLGDAAREPLGSREDPAGPGKTTSTSAVETHGGLKSPLTWTAAALVIVTGVAIAVAFAAGGEPRTEAGIRPVSQAIVDAGSSEAPDAGGPVIVASRELDAGSPDAGSPNAGPAEAPAPVDRGRRETPRIDPRQGTAPDPALSPAQTAYEEGRRRFLENDVQGAIASFEEAARAMPGNPQVHKQLGRAYMRAGNVERAAASYRRYLELFPDAPDRAIVERITQGH
jgi:eukaryotic-like serine/threonine-protein kinase